LLRDLLGSGALTEGKPDRIESDACAAHPNDAVRTQFDGNRFGGEGIRHGYQFRSGAGGGVP
jgi:hypothetical protein